MLAVLTILCQLPAGAATLTEDTQISTENMLAVLGDYPEDTSLRTEIEKHFRYGENGYIAAVYTDPVHYLDSNNEWKDIDNTLKLVAPSGDSVAALSSTGGYYENTANSFKVRLPQALSGTSNIQIQHEDHSLRFRMLNTSSISTAAVDNTDKTDEKKIELLQQSQKAADAEQREQLLQQAVSLLPNQAVGLTYANVQQNTHLVYRIDGQKLKENIILTAPTTQQSFSFAFTYAGLIPVVQEFGAVHFYDVDQTDGEPVFIIEAPYMEDANTQEDTLCMDIDVSVTPTATGCIYTMTPNAEWLNNPARVYPIIIDPSTTTSTSAIDIQDNGVNESDPGQNYKIVNRMYVGSNVKVEKDAEGKYVNVGYESRIYIRFPRVSAIGTSAYVSSAMLYLDHYPVADWQTADQNVLDVYEVPSNCNWDTNTIIWNTQAGYTFTNRIISYVTDADISADSANITSLVQKWYASTASNNGLVIKPQKVYKDKTNRTCYYSSDCDASYASKRPRITIIYFPAKTLNVPQYGQQYDKWCWAASAQMVAKYYGYTKTQRDIVFTIKKLPSDAYITEFNVTGTGTETIKAANYAAECSDFSVLESIDEEALFNKLLMGHPVILLRSKYNNSTNERISGHITVAYGYTCVNGTRQYSIRDPWPVNSDPWPSPNSGQSYIWSYSKIANEPLTGFTYRLVGLISK